MNQWKAGVCTVIFHKITKNDCFFIQLVDNTFKSDGLLHLSFEKFSLNIHIKYIMAKPLIDDKHDKVSGHIFEKYNILFNTHLWQFTQSLPA